MTCQPILTIAIPTYNRSEYLNVCLKRISDEIDKLSEAQRRLVCICISDNGSTDETPQVVEQYQERFGKNLYALRTSENKGMDFNFTRCYESATTKYVWIFGDDDVILSGGLEKVLGALVNNEIDLLYVNHYWFLDDFKVAPKKKECYGLVLYNSSIKFTHRTNVMLTFLSGLIVRTRVGTNYRTGLMGSKLVQLSWVLPLLRDGACFAIIEDWVIAARGANSGGYELVEVFGDNLIKITDDILKDKLNLAKCIQNGTIVEFFPGFILEFRKGNSRFSDHDMIIGLKNAFGDNWRYYFFLTPLFRLPLKLASYYYIFLKVASRFFRSILV